MPLLKRYLVRSVYDWAVESQLTPHILVDATYAGVSAPAQYVEGGRIAFNIHPRAVSGFDIDDDAIRFSARFNGQAMTVVVPMPAVLAVYARENGQGISFPEPGPAESDGSSAAETVERPRGAHLKVVK